MRLRNNPNTHAARTSASVSAARPNQKFTEYKSARFALDVAFRLRETQEACGFVLRTCRI